MPDPLSATANIVGLVGFGLTLVQGCIYGIELISIARDVDVNTDLQRARLVFAKQRLISWYDAVQGAADDPLHPARSLDWPSINRILQQLERLLTDAKALEEKYGLVVVPDPATAPSAITTQEKEQISTFERILRRVRPKKQLALAAPQPPPPPDSSTLSAFRRMKYAITGKTKIDALTAAISSLIEQVWGELAASERRLTYNAVRFLLREAISKSSDRTELEIIEQVLNPAVSADAHAAALAQPVAMLSGLKSRRLALRLDVTGVEDSGQAQAAAPKTIHLKRGEVVKKGAVAGGREAGVHKGRPVVIEWKQLMPEFEKKLYPRVEALAVLLSEAGTEAVGSLKCLGFFKDGNASRYGFVFELPGNTVPSAVGPNMRVLTLREMVLKKPCPPLAERSAIAARLVWCVQQLHTMGWLHKAIRPDNFLVDAGAAETSAGTYIAGFAFARAASPTEMSEPPKASPETDIYLHPELQNGEAVPFQKAFDVYALALTLLEVGLWSSLEVVLFEAVGFSATTPREMLSDIVPRVPDLLGDTGEDKAWSRLLAATSADFHKAFTTCLAVKERDSLEDANMSSSILTQAYDLLDPVST